MSSGGQGTNFLPNNGRVIQSGGTRILCVADVRGMLIAHIRKPVAIANALDS